MPNLDDQIIQKTSISNNKSGCIERPMVTMGTNVKNIFAIGDIIGGPWLAHKAMHDAINCINYIVSGKSSHKPKTMKFPGCIYSLPQITTVGYTEQQLKENNIPYKKGNFPFFSKWQVSNNVQCPWFCKNVI